jgi:protein XagA
MRADTGLDPSGAEQTLPAERRDSALGLFAEYGVTDRLTLQLKADWQEGEDAFVDYNGRGPIEIGATWQVWRDDRTAVSLYGGYARAGEGRNAGYAAPGVGEHDWEARASVGRSLKQGVSRWGMAGSFVELQAARRFRDGLPDETRIDVTIGARPRQDWLVMGQAFGGAADGGARWLSLEASAARDFGGWTLQAGWRHTVAGRETPMAHGPVLAIWRRF